VDAKEFRQGTGADEGLVWVEHDMKLVRWRANINSKVRSLANYQQ
jgi:hypothetical protein